MKLKSKIHLYSTLLMLVILIITNIGIYILFEKMAHDTEYNQLLIRSKEVTTSLSKMAGEMDAGTLVRAHLPPNGAIRVVDDKGKSKVTTESELGLGKEHFDTQPKERYTIGDFNGTQTMFIRVPIIWTDGEVVQLEMVQVLEDLKNNLGLLQLVLIGMTIVTMIPITLSSAALGRIVTQPVEKLISTMVASQQSGTYEKIQVSVGGKDELAQMVRTFNDMMEQLEQNYNKQEQFVSNASHELKTPLTVIESYARLLTRQGFDNHAVALEAVEAIRSETGRMKEMIAQMLELAKSNEHLTFEFAEIDLQILVEKTIQPMRQAYARDFIVEGNQSILLITDANRLKQLLFILLDNARKYSDKEIKIAVQEQEEMIAISIMDYGNGISEQHLPHIFDRFYRVDQDRNRKTGGTGLGLAIAKEIAVGLGAELKIESIVGMGTTIRILIPKERILIGF
ncbi:sensor histidine kinase [Sporosarcina sp. FSL K6-3457]|uniref:sensor histidine kinase n=1 Tax=Sporosarcina sp. FSL K6-3457 TaxID=2978204 RepID=UPI0030FAAEDF